ncbi:MAG: hypothetical protein PHO26_10035 [Dehalococcoidia bacterium]|nr:hypothetical protein [Dehalococcoidia bacterium]
MELRPYQQEVARAIFDSILQKKGLTFSVEIARQGGKNELSAHIEVLLLTMFIAKGGTSIKCSPTFKPQTLISMNRLKDRLDDFGYDGIWQAEFGYILRLGAARQVFLSADESSNVVGHTADLLLEVDESQDINQDKYSKEFRPMASSTNATSVHYGTTWDDGTLLEQTKQLNLELEKQDGIKRHFRYPWEEVAKYNPGYATFVESERQRLGDDHPLFRTQYRLLPLPASGRLFSRAQVTQVIGSHSRLRSRQPGAIYVAGIDIAGQDEQLDEIILTRPQRDATVVTISEVVRNENKEPSLKVVEHYAWIGKLHHELYPQLVAIIKNTWNCSRVLCDATGIGEPVASFLQKSCGARVQPFKFTQLSKSQLGFDLIAAVNSNRLKCYAGDGSREFAEFLLELEKAKSQYRPNQTINFFVDPSEGHDDYLMSLALCVKAAQDSTPRVATGGQRND